MEASAPLDNGGAIHPNLRPSAQDDDRQLHQRPPSQQQQQQHDDELHLPHLQFDTDPHHHHSLGGSAITGVGSNGDVVDLPYSHPTADFQPFSHHHVGSLLVDHASHHHHHTHFESLDQQHAAEFAELLGQHDHHGPSTFELGGQEPSSNSGGVLGGSDGSGGPHLGLSSSSGAVGIDPDTYVVDEDDDSAGLSLPFGNDHQDQEHDQVVNGLIGLAHGHSQPLTLPTPSAPPPLPSRKRKKAAPTMPHTETFGSGHPGGEGSQNGGKRREQVRNACTNCQKTRKKCSGDRPCAACLRNPSANPCVDSSRKKRPVGVKRGKYKTKNRKPEDGLTDEQTLENGHVVAGPSNLGLHTLGNPSHNLHHSGGGVDNGQQQHLEQQEQHEDAYTLYTHSTIDPSLDDPVASSDHHDHHQSNAADSGIPDDDYAIEQTTLRAVVEQAQAEARAQHPHSESYISGSDRVLRQGSEQIRPEREVDPHLLQLRLPSDHLSDPQASPSAGHHSISPSSSAPARDLDRVSAGRSTATEHDVSLAWLGPPAAADTDGATLAEDVYEPVTSAEQPGLGGGSGGVDEYEVIQDDGEGISVAADRSQVDV